MGDPTIAGITTFDNKVSTLDNGACREFWMRIPGLSAAEAATTGGSLPMYYLQNPLDMDLVVLNALVVITTADAQDADIDVGLGDNAAGTGTVGKEISESFINTPAGVYETTVVQAPAGGLKCVWKKAGSTEDSYLIIGQDGGVDATDLRWNLFLKVIPYADLIGDEGTQATIVIE